MWDWNSSTFGQDSNLIHRSLVSTPVLIHSEEREEMMAMLIQPQKGHGLHTRYQSALALGALLWLILPLIGCSSSRKEYVVDHTRGSDMTAEGSLERLCQTEGRCRILADRDGVRSYWMVYQ